MFFAYVFSIFKTIVQNVFKSVVQKVLLKLQKCSEKFLTQLLSVADCYVLSLFDYFFVIQKRFYTCVVLQHFECWLLVPVQMHEWSEKLVNETVNKTVNKMIKLNLPFFTKFTVLTPCSMPRFFCSMPWNAIKKCDKLNGKRCSMSVNKTVQVAAYMVKKR